MCYHIMMENELLSNLIQSCQAMSQLDFKSQITNVQLADVTGTIKIRANLTLRAKIAVTEKALKVKFDCT